MNLADFHFIRPYWLLATLGLLLALWLLKNIRVGNSGWSKLLPEHLSAVLIERGNHSKPFSLIMPFIIGVIAILALAGPTWQKLPQPVYQVKRGSVLIMDMSYSMYATDLTPNRLTRARYKAIDLLDNLNEGDIGLVAYAGDAFVISPLTEDINNLKLLLPSLSPDLMPELGSNPLAALYLANDMLTNAGHIEGDVYWFTDGIDYEDISDINDWSSSFPHRLNILGIGTADGAPIKLNNGELLKDDNGAIVLPRLNTQYLAGVAQKSSGNYQNISHKNNDIASLITVIDKQDDKQESENTNTGDQWQEAGPYLVILLLPLLLGYFRRGALSIVLFSGLLLVPNKKTYAVEMQDLWKTKDQQGQQHFSQENYQEAAKSFKDPMWKGSAHYKNGDYDKALKSFQQLDSAEALYNQGNAYAKLGNLEQAIDAYEKALERNPEDVNALANKKLVEQLKEQQEQQQEQQGDQSKDDNQQSQEGEQNQSEQDQGEENQDQQNSQDKNNQEQDSESAQQQSDTADGEQSDTEQNSDSQPSPNSEQNEQPSKEQQSDSQSDADPSDKEQEDAQQNQADENAELSDKEADQLQAQQARQEQIDQEKAQKYQQLLNKVTDDPHLLLRNKMQLEYQKRRQNGSQSGVKKKW